LAFGGSSTGWCKKSNKNPIYLSITFRDTASEHRLVGSGEVRLIQQGKVVDGRSKHNTVWLTAAEGWQLQSLFLPFPLLQFPFKAICSEVSVWAIWVAAIGNM
jgi:hypothetical protein